MLRDAFGDSACDDERNVTVPLTSLATLAAPAVLAEAGAPSDEDEEELQPAMASATNGISDKAILRM